VVSFVRRVPVATILELAAYADVSAENVLRVVHGEPVSDDVERRVYDAIEALGAPPYPRQVEVLPAIAPGTGTDELLERVRLASAELEAPLPEELGPAVSEAFRLEVRPVAQHVAELGALFERMLVRIEEVATSIEDERRDRLQDVALLTELVTSGWRSVDRRLARLEELAALLAPAQDSGPEAQLYRLDGAVGTTRTE
jgi:hypothetical protein